MTDDAPLPDRRRPVHLPVAESPNASAIVLLTVCTDRRRPLLTRSEIHDLLRHAWSDASHWIVGKYVLMPDHLHAFCAPAAESMGALLEERGVTAMAVFRRAADLAEKLLGPATAHRGELLDEMGIRGE